MPNYKDQLTRAIANHMLGSQRNGLNHVGMNMGGFDRVAGPLRDTDYPTYSDALLNWYQAKNVKSVRLMFTWEAVQSPLGEAVPVPAAGLNPAAALNYANY